MERSDESGQHGANVTQHVARDLKMRRVRRCKEHKAFDLTTVSPAAVCVHSRKRAILFRGQIENVSFSESDQVRFVRIVSKGFLKAIVRALVWFEQT